MLARLRRSASAARARDCLTSGVRREVRGRTACMFLWALVLVAIGALVADSVLFAVVEKKTFHHVRLASIGTNGGQLEKLLEPGSYSKTHGYGFGRHVRFCLFEPRIAPYHTATPYHGESCIRPTKTSLIWTLDGPDSVVSLRRVRQNPAGGGSPGFSRVAPYASTSQSRHCWTSPSTCRRFGNKKMAFYRSISLQ
jgi:hypothetical protein